MFKKLTTMFNLFKKKPTQQTNSIDIDSVCIEFATWLQDNYSQNKEQGSTKPLPKGYMRKDFTNDVYTIGEIFGEYKTNNVKKLK